MAKATATTQSSKLVTASARHLHLSPRKMRLVTNLVKGMPVNDALVQLQHTNKKASAMVIKLLKSAIANAEHNFSMAPDHLYIKSITTDMGVVMKRYFPRARGSAFPIRRKTCHVNVVLEERKSAKASRAKLNLFNRRKEETAEASVDQKEATNEKAPKTLGRKSEVTKTEQQVKLNTQQNKRRLFNRRAGE